VQRSVVKCDCGPCLFSDWVLGAVDKAEEIAFVEVLERLHLVDHRARAVEASHDLRGELEAQVELCCPDVKEEVSRSCGGLMSRASNLAEGMEAYGWRPGEQPAPGIGTDARNAREPGRWDAEPDRALQPAEVAEELADALLTAGVHRCDEEDGRVGEWAEDRLRRHWRTD
jgi:hypothetical protein